MVMFMKRSCKLIFKIDVYFRNIEVINYYRLQKNSMNCIAGFGIKHATFKFLNTKIA